MIEDRTGPVKQAFDLYVHDAEGRETARVRIGAGISELKAYDAAGRMVRRLVVENGREIDTTEITYDAAGRRVRETSWFGPKIYLYDDRGNLTLELETTDDGRRISEERHAYDAAGRRTDSWFVSDDDARHVHYFHDARGRVIVERDDFDGVGSSHTTFEYDERGNRVAKRFYDERGALIQLRRWAFDAAGNPTAETDFHLLQVTSTTETHDYSCWQ